MTGLARANKAGVKLGELHRVDAALTADGSTLVIWKELQKKMKGFAKQRATELKKKAKNTLKAKDENESLNLSLANESINKA